MGNMYSGVPLGFRALPPTFAQQVFDPRSRSIRKGCDGEVAEKKKISVY